MQPYEQVNIDFTTTSANYDLLQDINIQNVIKERYGIDDARYAEIVSDKGFTMGFDIYITASRVSVNNATYNELIQNTVYTTAGVVNRGVTSIRIEDDAISGTISMILL